MPVFQLTEEILFPPIELAEPDGLLAVGGDLSPERLIEAYRSGIFPWYTDDTPILWWSPAPRLVLFPEEFHAPKRFQRLLRQNPFTVKADTDFRQVIMRCSEKRAPNRLETWITEDMLEAYCHLYELGYAHSIECWSNDKLVGGLYGIALDRVFFGESMFSDQNNSSKVALASLVSYAKKTGICLIDCQIRTEHLIKLGAHEISRSTFHKYLEENIHKMLPQKKWRLLQD